eukprot:145561_1
MTHSLQNVKQIGLMIHGYIRCIDNSLRSSKWYLFQNIPESIVTFCLLYCINEDFMQTEHGTEHGTDKITVSDNCKTVTRIPRGPDWGCKVYGKNTIPSTSKIICDWYIKIITAGGPYKSHAAIKIGIDSRWPWKHKNDKLGIEGIIDPPYYYFNGYSGIISSREEDFTTNSNAQSYGKTFGEDDIVRLSLNLSKRCVSYFINKEMLGVAFGNVIMDESIEYKLCVQLCDQNACVEIVNFTIEYL